MSARLAQRLTRSVIIGSFGHAALAAGLVAVSPSALAQAAGTPTPINPAEVAAAGVVARAGQELHQGRPVMARAILSRALSSRQAPLNATDRDLAADLLAQASLQIKALTSAEVTTQSAEVALAEGDLRRAVRHADAILGGSGTSAGQVERARDVRQMAQVRRQELEPLAPALIAQAVSDFDAGRFGAAKSSLAALYRADLDLPKEQRGLIDAYQLRIIELENQRGAGFDAEPAALAVFQPGTVRSDEPAPATPSTPATPPAPSAPPAPRVGPAITIDNTPAPNNVPPTPPTPPAPAPTAAPTPAAPTTPATPAANADSVRAIAQAVRVQPTEPATPPAPPAPATPEVAPTAPAPGTPAQSGDALIQSAFRAEAQRTLAEATRAYDEARYNDAQRLLEQATGQFRAYLSPQELQSAEQRLSETRIRLRAPAGPGQLGQQEVNRLQLSRDRATAEFNADIEQGEAALAAGAFARARDLAAQARVTADNARQFFSQAETDAFVARVEDLSRRIAAEEERVQATRVIDTQRTLEQEAARREQQLRAEKKRRIDELLVRVRGLLPERKYQEALADIDQVLFLDPNDPTAELLRMAILDNIAFERDGRLRLERTRRQQSLDIESNEALLPPERILNFPSDWPARSLLRTNAGGFVDSPQNQSVISRLEGTRIPAKLNGTRLADALAYVSATAGVTIDPDWNSLATVGIQPETPVEIDWPQEASAEVVLKRLLAKASTAGESPADYAVADGIVTVASAADVQRQTVTLLYNITDLLFEVPDFTDVPNLDLAQALRGGGAAPSGRRNPFDPGAGRGGGEEPGSDARSQRVREIIRTVQKLVAPDSWRENGGDVGSIQELNGTLLVSTTPRNHAELQGLLTRLRELRSVQISVEGRFLTVAQDYFERIAFDLDLVFGADNSQIDLIRSVPGLENFRGSDLFDFTSATALNPRVQGPAIGGIPIDTSVPPDGIPDALSPTLAPDFTRPLTSGLSPIGVGQNSFGLASGLFGASGVSSDLSTLAASAPALGIAGQFLDDIQVDFLITATQADRRSTLLNAPRITLTNGQTSAIAVSTQQSFVSDLTPIVGDSSAAFDPIVTPLNTGTTFRVNAVASADRRFVLMNVEITSAVLVSFGSQPVTAVVGGTLVDSADIAAFIQTPLIDTTQLSTTVTVPDEGTVLLGGQRIISEFEVEVGVPVLSKLPIINRFFTNRIDAREESTLLILVKPTIVITGEEEERSFPGLQDALRSGLSN